MLSYYRARQAVVNKGSRHARHPVFSPLFRTRMIWNLGYKEKVKRLRKGDYSLHPLGCVDSLQNAPALCLLAVPYTPIHSRQLYDGMPL